MSLLIDLSLIIPEETAAVGRGREELHLSRTKCGLTCASIQAGSITYRANRTTFLILREQVRNLRWHFPVQAHENSSCPVGTVFIIPDSMELAIDWPEPTEILIGQFNGVGLRDMHLQNPLIREINATKSVVKFVCKECLPISSMIWDEICLQAEQDEPYLRALGLVLMHTIARNALDDRVVADTKIGLSKSACRQIETYLTQNFHKSLSVPDMAAVIGISAGHFSTCFRNSIGQTPHQYLLGLRLDEAERLLRKTSMSIREIASHLNFSSQSHLTTALRKYRRLTPGELRNRL
ncbi:AraC family transcriptional regulator [Ochrobactrum sp. BD67]